MSIIKDFRVSSKPSKFSTNTSRFASQDMSIRIKNGVAVISGCSTSTNVRRETAKALGQVSGVNQVIDLVKSCSNSPIEQASFNQANTET